MMRGQSLMQSLDNVFFWGVRKGCKVSSSETKGKKGGNQ